MKKNLFLIPMAMLVGMSVATAVYAAPPEKPKPIELIASYPFPGTGVVADSLWRFCDYVEKHSQGRVRFKRYPGGQLASHPEHLELVGSGGAHVAALLSSLFPDQLHFTAMQHEQLTTIEKATRNLYHIWFENALTAPYFRDEWKKRNLRFMNVCANGEIGFLFRKSGIRTLADLKGIRMGTLSDDPYMKEFGMNSVVMAIPDIYEGLSRGQVDGFMLSASAFMQYKHHEVTREYMDLGLALVTGHIFMNAPAYNKLPPDLKKVFDDAGKDVMEFSIGNAIKEKDKAMTAFKEKGLEIVSLSDAEKRRHFKLYFKDWEDEFMERAKKKKLVEQSANVVKVFKERLGQDLFTN
jgi:TRAP-type C4-dicarboxylate transport system substrate-binding protein